MKKIDGNKIESGEIKCSCGQIGLRADFQSGDCGFESRQEY